MKQMHVFTKNFRFLTPHPLARKVHKTFFVSPKSMIAYHYITITWCLQKKTKNNTNNEQLEWELASRCSNYQQLLILKKNQVKINSDDGEYDEYGQDRFRFR